MYNYDIKKKPKTKTTSQLKKELDKVFSEYIRKKYADENGYVVCYTCGARKHWKDIQNGHFVSRVHLATRFDEDNCRPQDVGCNVFGQGRIAVFATKLDKELGPGTTQRLYLQAQKIIKYFPYEQKIEEYKNKLKEL